MTWRDRAAYTALALLYGGGFTLALYLAGAFTDPVDP